MNRLCGSSVNATGNGLPVNRRCGSPVASTPVNVARRNGAPVNRRCDSPVAQQQVCDAIVNDVRVNGLRDELSGVASQPVISESTNDGNVNHNPPQLRILNWNIEGLTRKLSEADFMQYVTSFDIACFTETFLEFRTPLDCFSDFVQFLSPAVKVSRQARGCGGVMIMVKRKLVKHVTLLDDSQDNMIWLKIDKLVFGGDRDVVFCAVYACPYDSPYYQQEHVTVNSTIIITEQCLLNYIEQFDDSCYFLMCGDFNARTKNLNATLDDEDGDVQSVVQSELYGSRQSEDLVVNMFGNLLLEMCATCNLTILNGTCQGDLKGSFTYVCSSGCSTVDYFLASKELNVGQAHLEVAERFESKHLPVELMFFRDDRDKKKSTTGSIEKLMWDESKKSVFVEAVSSAQFETVVVEATVMLPDSVDSAVDCLTAGLLQAATCMKRKIYTGQRHSKWFDRDCKTARDETRKWWRLFRRAKCTQNKTAHRLSYVENRKSYRFLLTSKRQSFKQNKLAALAEKAKDSKLFWSELKSIRQSAGKTPDITSEQWFTHFKNVFSADLGNTQAGNDEHLVDPENTDIAVECLDMPISPQEVASAIKNLNPNKSAGPDGILAGMLINSAQQTLPFIVELFNTIFDSGNYPAAWTGAIVVPIHKSGDVDTPDNYRGISLLSILGKVFATILNKRLSGWASENNKIDEVQSGFRAGYSTIDNVFVLFSIVQKYLLKRSGKLYVCFVDFRKAFDCVNRAILWNTLRKAGVGGKMLRILQSMYKSVRSCVRCPDSITDFFECPIGVRQGCVLSPTLFSFLINELAVEVSEKGIHGVQLTPDVIQILILLFADDVALTSFSAWGLQKQINILKNFADNFGMSVNLSKTKVIVFRKGGFLAEREQWKYGNERIEVVNSYKYLGLHFTTKLSLTKAIGELAVKAKVRTMQILRCLFRLGDVPSSIFFKIFDAQILPVLMYGAEVWGFQAYGDIEKVHLFACKRLLRVGQQTPNRLVYGDLGRHPLFINSAIRVVKYWLRLIAMPQDRLPRKAYLMSCALCDSGKKSWSFYLKNILCENGCNEAWQQQSVGDIGNFLRTLRERLINRFKADWDNDIQTRERYVFYAKFKRSFKIENYVDCSQLRCFKIAYVQFRFGISPINCHRMRYKRGVTPQQLLCPVCKTENEDEEHVLLNCTAYDEFRSELSVFAANDDVAAIMSADDDKNVMDVSNFLYKVFKKRSQYIS